MDLLNIRENCKELKMKFRKQYPVITEEDIECNAGLYQEMVKNIQQKLGLDSKEVNEIILKL